MKIRENTLGSGHPNVAVVLENMAELYIEVGKIGEAEKMAERAEKIRLE